MRKLHLLLLCLAVSLLLFSAWKISYKTSGKIVNTTNDSMYEKDILPDILLLNSNENIKPSKEFRKGTVERTTLKNYFHKTANGYYIQLPSETNVPTPAVIDGNIYLSGGFGSRQYYQFEAKTGQLKWAIDLDDDGPSSPAIQDGIIVFNTESCTIFACDLVTGKLIWSYYLGDPLMSMPTIANGIVFTSYPAPYFTDLRKKEDHNKMEKLKIIPTHVMIAIDLKTGKILWQKWIDSDIMSAPVAKEDLLYVTTFSGALYKVKQKTGEIIEAKAIRATSVPIFSGSEVIVSRRNDDKKDSLVSESLVFKQGAEYKTVYQKQAYYLDVKVQGNAKLKTLSEKMDAGNGFVNGAPVSANSVAAMANIGYSNVSSLQSFQGSRGIFRNGRLFNTMGDEIVCTDPKGDVKWKYKLDGDLKKEGGFMGTPPIYTNGFLIVATFTGDVLTIDEKSGKLVNKYEVKNPIWYQPVVDNGWIYVTTTNGRLYGIDTGNPLITGWNMWGANAARTNVN